MSICWFKLTRNLKSSEEFPPRAALVPTLLVRPWRRLSRHRFPTWNGLNTCSFSLQIAYWLHGPSSEMNMDMMKFKWKDVRLRRPNSNTKAVRLKKCYVLKLHHVGRNRVHLDTFLDTTTFNIGNSYAWARLSRSVDPVGSDRVGTYLYLTDLIRSKTRKSKTWSKSPKLTYKLDRLRMDQPIAHCSCPGLSWVRSLTPNPARPFGLTFEFWLERDPYMWTVASPEVCYWISLLLGWL